MVAEMGGLAEKQVADSVDALAKRDTALAQRVTMADANIDTLQREIEEKAVLTIARRQPMAVDLREVVGALRLANDLERIGDLAKNIAKRVMALNAEFPPPKLIRGVEHMTDLVLQQMKLVLDSYGRRDVSKAMAVWRGDEEIDAVCTSVFREIADLHDGRSAQYHLLHPPDVLRQEHRTHGRPRHQHRGNGALHYRRPSDRRSAPERRHDHDSPRCVRRPKDRLRMNARILIVEDEEPLTMLLRYNLEAEGYEVETSARGDEADTRLKETTPDLIVLDWMLPGLSGIELCRRLRARPETRQLPIIMLTARGEESEKVRGLATGADDYIVKPFSVPELLARVRALLRRANPDRVASVLNIGDIELDREKKRVSRNGRPVDLGPTEYRLLEFLMERPGRVFSREQLLDGVWGSDIYIDERTVDVHVGRLRKAINRGETADPIRTVRGAGYALDDRFGRMS